MGRIMAQTVYLTNDNGVIDGLLEGTELPDWAEGRISNPDAFVPEMDAAQSQSNERPAESASKAKWLAYAEHVGVDHDEDATKAEIIAAVEEHETKPEV